MTDLSRLTLVIATRNRSVQLARVLEKLSRVARGAAIIVVDNASSDDTIMQVRRRFPEVRVLSLDRNAGAGARTIGVELAETPFVAFSDDDSWWKAGALTRALRLMHEYPRLGLIAARVLVGTRRKLDPISSMMRKSPLESPRPVPGKPVLGFLACGAVVRRQAFLEVGGFKEEFGIGGEEQLLSVDLAAANWDVCYVDEIVAYHHPLPSSDRRGRHARMIRNDLWSVWLRRPLDVVVRQTARVLREAVTESDAKAGLVEALKGLPWVLGERRALPREIETSLRRLESTAASPVRP